MGRDGSPDDRRWLAEAVNEHLLLHDVTVSDFAVRAGVDVSTVRRWRNAENWPTADKTLGGLAYALGRTVGGELLERAGWPERVVDGRHYIDDPLDDGLGALLDQVRRLNPDDQRRLLAELQRLEHG